MRYMKPLLKIEWKSRNYYLHTAISIGIFLALVGAIKFDKESFAPGAISFSIFSFFLLGLIWTITMLEDLRNNQDSRLIKTYVSYPITSVNFIASKQVLFFVSDIISSLVGSITAYATIGNFNVRSLELFVLATFFAVLASHALFLLASLVSRYGLLAEIVVVFYYFIIFFIAFSIISQNSVLFSLFPYMIFFQNILSLHASNISLSGLTEFPALYSGMIILGFLFLKIFKWWPLFDYD